MAGCDGTNERWLQDYERAINRDRREEMDMSAYSSGESKDLKAKDFIGKNLKVKIAGIEIRNYPATEDKQATSKPVLSFEGKEKVLVLNPTNNKTLCAAYGNDSEKWIGHQIGLSVIDYTDKGFSPGWVVKPLDVKAPDFDDALDF